MEGLQKQLAELMQVINKECNNNADGTSRIKVEVYLSQFGLYFVLNPALFLNDLSKVVFVLSYLTSIVSTLAQPFNQCVFTRDAVTFNEFTVAFQGMYFDTKKKSWAEKALRILKQTSSVLITFTIHAHILGWEAQNLVSRYT